MVRKMHYIKNILKSNIEWIIRLVLNIPPGFKVKQKWSSSSHFHFLVLVPMAAMIPFLECTKEINMLPSK